MCGESIAITSENQPPQYSTSWAGLFRAGWFPPNIQLKEKGLHSFVECRPGGFTYSLIRHWPVYGVGIDTRRVRLELLPSKKYIYELVPGPLPITGGELFALPE